MKNGQWSISSAMDGPLAFTLALGVLLMSTAPIRAAGGKPTTAPPEVVQTPQEVADRSYNAGLAHRDKAWKLEAEAAEAEDGEVGAKLRKKIEKQYRRAISEFRVAIRNSPRMHQAFSSLGYALRKTGDYEEALVAYDRALELVPGYAEAVEYRGETYLHLGRLDDVKSAYMELFATSRNYADELLTAVDEWLELEHGETVEGIDDFRQWAKERGELARQTAELAGDSQRWGS